MARDEAPLNGRPTGVALDEALGNLANTVTFNSNAGADLTFLNLECVLADTDAGEAKKTWRIRAPTKYGAR